MTIIATPVIVPATGLEHLAERINDAHREARYHASRAVERALEAGDLLLEVKSTLGHGEWLPWLAQHCPDVSRRSAQGYMRLARDLPLEMRNVAHLTLNGAMRLLSAPKPEADAEADAAPAVSLETWLATHCLWGSDYAPWAFILDAEGETPEGIASLFASNAARYPDNPNCQPPTAAEISAWLSPRPPEREDCCSRSPADTRRYSPEGADAEAIYHRTLRNYLASFSRMNCEHGAVIAETLNRPDLAASLNGAARVYARAVPQPTAPRTLLEQAAVTAAMVDAIYIRTENSPFDGGRLPTGMWCAVCLRLALEEEGPPWEGARATFKVPVTTEAVEDIRLFQAGVVLLQISMSEVQA